jgi:hypothetical protein
MGTADRGAGHARPFAKALEAVFSPKGRLLPALRELLAY